MRQDEAERQARDYLEHRYEPGVVNGLLSGELTTYYNARMDHHNPAHQEVLDALERENPLPTPDDDVLPGRIPD